MRKTSITNLTKLIKTDDGLLKQAQVEKKSRKIDFVYHFLIVQLELGLTFAGPSLAVKKN